MAAFTLARIRIIYIGRTEAGELVSVFVFILLFCSLPSALCIRAIGHAQVVIMGMSFIVIYEKGTNVE